MSSYTKTYTANKGWPAKFKGKTLTWTNYTTPEEAVQSGDFKDAETLTRAAYAMLDIARGHAASAAANEVKDGKPVGEALSVAELETIARGRTYGKGFSRRGSTGGIKAKTATKVGRRAAEVAQAAAADPKRLAALRAAGFSDADLAEMGITPNGAETAPAAGAKARK